MSAFGGVRHEYEGFGFDDRPRRLRTERFDDELDFSGAPVALSGSRRPKAVTGSVTPKQTMHAITTGGGKNVGRQSGLGGQQPDGQKPQRQTGPKLSGKARRAARKNGGKG